jgi:hypothetical protein
MGIRTAEVSARPQAITGGILTILPSEGMDCILEIRMEVEWAWDTHMDKEGLEWECTEEEVRQGMEENRKCQSHPCGSSRLQRLT